MSIEFKNLKEFRRKFQEKFGINPKGKNLSQLIGATAGKSGYFTAGLPVEGFNGRVHFDPAQDDYIRINIGSGFNVTDNLGNPAFIRRQLSAVGVSGKTINELIDLAGFKGSKEEMKAKADAFNSRHPNGIVTPEQGVALFANMESHFRKVAAQNSPGFSHMNEYQKEVLTYHAYKHTQTALGASRYRVAGDIAKQVARGELDPEKGAKMMAKHHSSYYGGKEDRNAARVLPAVTAASAADTIEERARPALEAWAKKAGKRQANLMHKAMAESLKAPQFAARNPDRDYEFNSMGDLIASRVDRTQQVNLQAANMPIPEVIPVAPQYVAPTQQYVAQSPETPQPSSNILPKAIAVVAGASFAGLSLKDRIGAFLAKSKEHMGVVASNNIPSGPGPFDAVVDGTGPFDAVAEPSFEELQKRKRKQGMRMG